MWPQIVYNRNFLAVVLELDVVILYYMYVFSVVYVYMFVFVMSGLFHCMQVVYLGSGVVLWLCWFS